MNDNIEPKKAQTIGGLCLTMLKSIEATTIEERLEKLERFVDIKDVTPKQLTSDIRRMVGTIEIEAKKREGRNERN